MTDRGTHREASRRRAARRLAALLEEVPHYRQKWEREARRSPAEGVNYTAVARVLMDWWDREAVRDVGRGNPPLDLVRRALTGEVLAPQTLDHLIRAFDFKPSDEEELWALYSGGSCDPDDG